MLGGGTGVPDKTTAGTQFMVVSGCAPGSAACGGPNIDFDAFSATQGGSVVSEKNVKPGSTPIIMTGVMAGQDSWIIGNNAPWTWQNGSGLTNSYITRYSDQNLQFLVTSVDPTNGPVVSNITGSATMGFGYGGTATPASDMTTLKNNNVTATYNGFFRGIAGQTVAVTSINSNNGTIGNAADLRGQTALTANFGAGTVNGNVYNMQRVDASNTASAAPYGIRMDGTIAGSTYSGTARYTSPLATSGASALSSSPSGQMIGGFFGAQAAETAGVVRIEGTAPGTGAGTGANAVLVGGFGAKKNP